MVAAPGIDADGNNAVAVFFDSPADAFEDFPIEADDIPERSAGKVGAGVVEAVHFLEFDFREIGGGGDDTAAAGTQIHSNEGFDWHDVLMDGLHRFSTSPPMQSRMDGSAGVVSGVAAYWQP